MTAAAAARAVVVTRDEPYDGPLSARLRELGLEVLWWPVVRVLPPSDPAALQALLGQLEQFDWIVFTSRHAVEAVTGQVPVAPRRVRVAAVGASTAAALHEQGWSAAVVPEHASAASLLQALTPLITPGARILFPASSRALPTLAGGLRQLGAQVVQVEAYRTQGAALDVRTCRARIEHASVGAVTFTSPSGVDELEQALGSEHFKRLLAGSAPVVLGATTGRALAHRGFQAVLAEPATLEGLAATTYRCLNERP